LHSPFFRTALAALAVGFFTTFAIRAEAHALGLSQGDYSLGPGGHVDAHLVFAGADAATLARGETAPDLRDAVLHGVEVLADGETCIPSYLGETAVGGDGLEIHAAFDCPHSPRELTVSLPLLDELSPSHVHLARLSSADRETQDALRSSSARATLVLVDAPSTPLFTRARLLATALVLLAFLAAAVATWRWRRTTRP
jgi:hypothetical protein